MKLLVTGATGFIGSHLIPLLLRSGHEVTVIVRDTEHAKVYDWFVLVQHLEIDIYQNEQITIPQLENYNALIHLAWSGLPNYNEMFHLETNLPAEFRFLGMLIENGLKHLLVTGTCAEYGMQYGPLSEETETQPITPYALAKDTLRKYLQAMQKKNPGLNLQWARLFYMYGEGQSSHSLLAKLETALKNGSTVFNMSGGEQLRDYLPVEEVAGYLLKLVENPDIEGVVNICSGQPISVRRLVEGVIETKQTEIKLNLGYYPYLDYEPMAFWGCPKKMYDALNKLERKSI